LAASPFGNGGFEKGYAMSSTRLWILSFIALFIAATGAAQAADYLPPPPPAPCCNGWYLRGDIGFSNQRVDSLFNANYAGFTSVNNIDKSFDAAPFFGLGVGYTVNDWFRVDVTGEYRGKANFHGLDVGAIPGGGFADDRYTASKYERTFLVNGYVDLGTWYKVTPFIGAGVGVSRNTINNFGDFSTCVNSLSCAANGGSDAYAGAASKWQFAWALYAGLGYQLSRDVTVELAYRYLDLGDARSGDVVAFDGTNNFYNPQEFRGLTSHDLKLGLRMNLDALAGNPEPIVYAPPPPPLRSRD
jgi:opacity protein-like surface antigen